MTRYGAARPARPDKVERGQVWIVDFEPVMGKEMNKERPALVLSSDVLNSSGWRLATVIPFSTKRMEGNELRMEVRPPLGGLRETSFAVCDYLRTISQARLISYLGRLPAGLISEIGERVRISLEI
ncbi:MAG: type II toxin-antitoxin system PemK/MazF family toxin [Actinomycetota bacterium]